MQTASTPAGGHCPVPRGAQTCTHKFTGLQYMNLSYIIQYTAQPVLCGQRQAHELHCTTCMHNMKPESVPQSYCD